MTRLLFLGLCVPLALAAARWDVSQQAVVGLALVGLAVASHLLGDATEDIAVHAGPRTGGLVTAFLGGTAELVVLGLALAAGHLDFVKAAIAGCLIANLLVVLGLSATLGGLRHGTQYFDREAAGIAASMMMMSLVALAVPALYGQFVPIRNAGAVESLSVAVALVMLCVYFLSVYYSLYWNIEEQAVAGVHRVDARYGPRLATARFAVAAVAIAALGALALRGLPAAVLAPTGGPAIVVAGVVVPLVTTVAEHLHAVASAWNDRLDVSVAVATGSSMRIALLLAPLLVLGSLALGSPMDLILTQLELAALAGAAIVTSLVALDGQSNWIEGAMLLAVYVIFGLALLWWPAL